MLSLVRAAMAMVCLNSTKQWLRHSVQLDSHVAKSITARSLQSFFILSSQMNINLTCFFSPNSSLRRYCGLCSNFLCDSLICLSFRAYSPFLCSSAMISFPLSSLVLQNQCTIPTKGRSWLRVWQIEMSPCFTSLGMYVTCIPLP